MALSCIVLVWPMKVDTFYIFKGVGLLWHFTTRTKEWKHSCHTYCQDACFVQVTDSFSLFIAYADAATGVYTFTEVWSTFKAFQVLQGHKFSFVQRSSVFKWAIS